MKDLLAIALFGGFCLLVTPSYGSDCSDANFDVWKVSKALSQGLSKTDLLAHLDASRAELSAERMEKIRGLIDEVYLLDQSQAEAWWKAHYKTCAKEDEA